MSSWVAARHGLAQSKASFDDAHCIENVEKAFANVPARETRFAVKKAKVLPGRERDFRSTAWTQLPTDTGVQRYFCGATVLTTSVWGLLPFIT